MQTLYYSVIYVPCAVTSLCLSLAYFLGIRPEKRVAPLTVVGVLRNSCLSTAGGVFTCSMDPVDRVRYSDDEEEEEEKPPGPEAGPGERLLWAAQHGDLQQVRTILDKDPGAISFRDSDGYSALHRASYSGHTAVVADLLSRGADICALTADGWTPLHSAARWDMAECVELLLNAGASPNALTNSGQTVLHLAAFHGDARRTLQLLFMQPNLDGSAKNCQGDTARDVALRSGKCGNYFDLLEDAVNKLER